VRHSDGGVCACKVTDKQRMGPESAEMLQAEADMQQQLMALGCDGFLKLLGANVKGDPFRACVCLPQCFFVTSAAATSPLNSALAVKFSTTLAGAQHTKNKT
jgi:hypothetical protein